MSKHLKYLLSNEEQSQNLDKEEGDILYLIAGFWKGSDLDS